MKRSTGKRFGSRLVITGLLVFCMMLGGCAREGSTEETGSTEVVPSFEIPDDTVMEAVSTEIETETKSGETASEMEETTQGVTVQIPETSSEEPTEPETRYVVVLDPGHGGVWLGATNGSLYEKDLALKVAFYVQAYLTEHYEGVEVYLTRSEDKELSLDQKADLEERVKIADSYGADILVSLHFNTDGVGHTSTGALICASKQPWVTEQCQALGSAILAQLEQLGIANRGFLMPDSTEHFDENGQPLDYYAICRHSASLGFPGIIVEHCFMDNPEELRFVDTEEALQRLAQADAVGIAMYLDLQEK